MRAVGRERSSVAPLAIIRGTVPEPDAIIVAALRRMGLVRAPALPRMTPLAGGVSSDIWRVDLPAGPVCVKRALPRLRVDAVWEAPVERNRYEWEWLREAGRIVPSSVPPLVAHDSEAGCFAMGFLAPEIHPPWKALLRDGIANETTARAVGKRLAAIHAATAARHPDLAARLQAIVSRTAGTKRALVHGDVSPKNILIGPDGPVFLDAECAWYGDPAFDLAFCLNHLLLKCLWTPAATAAFLRSFDTLAGTYLAGVQWEARAEVEARAAALLPGLFLARVDGKSPVEYVTAEADRERVRRTARPLILSPPATLGAVRAAWTEELRRSA